MNAMRISLATLCLGALAAAMPATRAATVEKRAPMVKIDDEKFNDWLALAEEHYRRRPQPLLR